jgi:CYTH domain-containing protein
LGTCKGDINENSVILYDSNVYSDSYAMIENELKYVIGKDICSSIINGNNEYKIIQQGYVGDARVRRTVRGANIVKTDFNYKIPLLNGEVEEIEVDISDEAFSLMIRKATNIINKYRYTYSENDSEIWDVDFFLNDEGDIYFCMAECEMPTGRKIPLSIPKFISQRLIYAVPREESSKFSSKKIQDVSYAENLLQKL